MSSSSPNSRAIRWKTPKWCDFLPVVPAGFEQRRDRLVDALQDRRRPGREVVVEQHHAGIEVDETDAAALAHDRLQRELPATRQVERRRLLEVGNQRADANAHAGLAQDALKRGDVLQVERVAGVVLGDQQHAARVRADALDRRLHRLDAERQEGRVEVVEPAREEVGVDRRQLEAGIAQVDRGVERHFVLLPLRAQPALDVGHPVEDALLEVLQRAGERGRQVGNHGFLPCREEPGL